MAERTNEEKKFCADSGVDQEERETFLTKQQQQQQHHALLNVKTYTLLISMIYACCSAGTAIIIGTVTTLQRAFGFSSTQVWPSFVADDILLL